MANTGLGGQTAIAQPAEHPQAAVKMYRTHMKLNESWRAPNLGGESLETRDMLAMSPSLIADVRSLETGAYPHYLTSDGNHLFFATGNGTSDDQLWKTDGTPAGTVSIVSEMPIWRPLAIANGRVVFRSGPTGDVWVSDTDGSNPVLLKAQTPSQQPLGLNIDLVNVAGTIFFMSPSPAGSAVELWKTDGTAAGTFLVKELPWVTTNSTSKQYAVLGDTLYFVGVGKSEGQELWKTDGTLEGTQVIRDIMPGPATSNPQNLTIIGNFLYFSASDPMSGDELWRTDGTFDGTVRFRDLAPGSGSSNPRAFTNVNGTLYFMANGTPFGTNLWKSDGTDSGTVVVTDLSRISVGISNLTASGNTLFFVSQDNSRQIDLWRTNGTDGGTLRLKSFPVGKNSSSLRYLVDVHGTLYFVATAGGSGAELWKSDGTAKGTVQVADIWPGADGSFPSELVNAGGRLYFVAHDGMTGRELWTTDGTPAGTVQVRNLSQGTTGSSVPSSLTVAGKYVYFTAISKPGYQDLWRTDGTAHGTLLLAQFSQVGDPLGAAWIDKLTAADELLYFVVRRAGTSTELWRSDGSLAGTVRVTSQLPALGASTFDELAVVNGTLFLTGDSIRSALWMIDGVGDRQLLNSAFSASLFAGGQRLYFVSTGVQGRELWSSDGTVSGTQMVKDIAVGAASADPGNLLEINGVLYFTADDGTHGRELWKTDGTEAGTVMVADLGTGAIGARPTRLKNIDGVLYFIAFDGVGDGSSGEVWQTDGTPEGTRRVDSFLARSLLNSDFVSVGDSLYFAANDGSHGREIWKSDGTDSGTFLIKDIEPGIVGSSPIHFTKLDGNVYFMIRDRQNAWRLGRTDGTDSGTSIFDLTFPDYNDGRLLKLTTFQDKLFFAAFDDQHGLEPWVIRHEPILGDLNDDRIVDAGDIAMFIENWTGALAPSVGGRDRWTGDLDGDGDADSADLLLLLANWSQVASALPATYHAGPPPPFVSDLADAPEVARTELPPE